MFYSLQELADLKKSDMKSFRNIIVDERNILVWQGLIVPVSYVLSIIRGCIILAAMQENLSSGFPPRSNTNRAV